MSKFNYLKLRSWGRINYSLKEVEAAKFPKLSVYQYSDSFGNLDREEMIAVHCFPLSGIYNNSRCSTDLPALMKEVNLFNEDPKGNWLELLEIRETARLVQVEKELEAAKKEAKALKKKLKKIKEMKNDRATASNS